MARPGNRFPTERPGSTCGASWPDPLRVTGRLSATNTYGSDIFVDRPPVAEASDLRRGQGLLSWAGPHEERVRQAFELRIRETLDDLVTHRAALGDDNADAVEGLLRMAVENLDVVDAIHEKWVNARWPLSRLHYSDECTTELDMGKVYGGGFARCPTYGTHLERDADRDEIVRRFVDAAHAIRCAEFGMWRVVLYRRALEKWKRTPQGGGPGGLAPTPPTPTRPPAAGGGGFVAQPPPPPPPPVEPTPPNPVLPEFPPELGGESLPPAPPPEPPPSLGEPEGLGEPTPTPTPPVGDGSGMPGMPSAQDMQDDFDKRAEADRETFNQVAKVGIGAVVVGGVLATAVTGAAIYGVVKLVKSRKKDDDEKGKGKRR